MMSYLFVPLMSMVGPDMTKIGTNSSVSWDVLLEPNSKLVVFAFPQFGSSRIEN